jgi:hypothetical protein
VQSLHIEKLQWKEEQAEKEALIKALDKARRNSVKVINELKKPKPESTRTKTLRRFYNLQPDESCSGLDGYMEPWVLDVTKSQARYDIALKTFDWPGQGNAWSILGHEVNEAIEQKESQIRSLKTELSIETEHTSRLLEEAIARDGVQADSPSL